MKRGLTIVIVVLVIVASGVGLLWYVGSKSLTDQTNNTIGFIKITQKDTDQDGLSDPEEALWGTDINNPDTNNDGIADGNSIQKNIDPAKEGGGPITSIDDRIQALIQNAINQKGAPLVAISPTQIPTTLVLSEKDLQITKVETVATVTKYRDDIRQIFRTYLTQVTGTEPESLIEFIEQGNDAALIAISIEREKYLNFLKELSAVTIPASAVPSYLAMLNKIGQIVELIHYMSQIKTEPLLALKSSQLLPIEKYEFLTLVVPVNDYFIQRGIHEKLVQWNQLFKNWLLFS